MDAQALATTPIFTVSLALCALLTVYGFTIFLKNILSKAAVASASRGLIPHELQSVQHASSFHRQAQSFLDTLSTVEELASEIPASLQDPSWSRLLEIADELEVARGELHKLLQAKNFGEASKLGSFLSGVTKPLPEYLDISSSANLQKLLNWHENSRNLLQRFITRLEGYADPHSTGPHRRLSRTFSESIAQVKRTLDSDQA